LNTGKSASFEEHTTLGRTGLQISRIGLAGGYGVPATAVEKAFHEFGINYFYWVSRKPGMRDALRELAKKGRESLVIAVQSYDHGGFFLRRSVEKALRELGTDYIDILFLGWFNKMPSRRLREAAQRLKEGQMVRFLGVTGHNRRFHGEMARREDTPFDVIQVRYSVAHRGAETEVFEGLPPARPGISTYTATRWGKLLRAKNMPPREAPLTAAECYRFALSHPAVDVCMAGPKTEQQMKEGLQALSEGPLDPREMERVRMIGDHVHG
jgi:aryl-alcohol dehydrogenase-like predicted oxidoreductase